MTDAKRRQNNRLLGGRIDAYTHDSSRHGGHAVGSRGDSLLAEFPSVVEAVQCAVEMQRELKDRNAALPVSRRVEFRLGINLGEVVVEGEEIYGEGVNIAVRLEGLAEAGGICISEVVYDQVRNRLALEYEELGEQELKNIEKAVRVWRVRVESEEIAPRSEEMHASTSSARTVTVRTAYLSRTALVAVGLLIAGALVTLLYPSWHTIRTPQSEIRNREALPLPDKPFIAVLPFDNMSGDSQQEYLGDSMANDLIVDLTKLSSLVVIARHSSFTYKGKAMKVQDVGRELGVRYVLEGSVRKVGDRMLITAQLGDVTTGGQVWAERYDRPLQDFYTVEEEVRRKILVHLALALTEEDHERLERTYTSNAEAYDHLRHAREFWFRSTSADNAQARQLCE